MSPTYFTDRDLGKQFPAALRDAGISVERHDDHFKQSTPDVQWIAEVARRRWIAVTRDKRIRYKPNEITAVMDASLQLLVIVGDASSAALASNFVASIARIDAFFADHPGPVIARLYRPSPGRAASGSIEQAWPRAGR